jgi:L-alanine-DL-glutamate epimerase-like enolase superfamily enzyme
MELNRRNFIKTTGAATAFTLVNTSGLSMSTQPMNALRKRITIAQVDSQFEREPLIRPFGFKGGYMSEIWQTMAMMKSTSGIEKLGLCTQSVLWSDASVFASHSEAGGNAIMYAMSERALRLCQGKSYSTPIDLLDQILEEVYEYGKEISGNPHLRKTFALNALVGIDNAAWLLYAAENGITNFDDLIPDEHRQALSHHHQTVASIPLMAYTIPISEIRQAAEEGYFFMKIKIGQPGTQQEMLQKDMERLSAIHKAIGHMETPYSRDGTLPYYFDANGRYEKKETLMRLLDHARKIGAFDQIALIEEPFPEHLEVTVNDMGIRIAADESAHTDEDAIHRMEMGYEAIALKAIAKTLSMTMRIASAAEKRGVPCFCADLTVNPILVEWNKVVAARLAPFPGLGLGLLETNGHQNYRNWDTMVGYHPYPDAEWRKTKDGVFNLDEDYYQKSGGIFTGSPHYQKMLRF